LGVIAVSVSYLFLLDYPWIVRSAYYINPYYVFKVLHVEYLKNKTISDSKAMKKIKELGFVPTGEARFLYLSHEPRKEMVNLSLIDCNYS
jgi:hypothetical protein